MSMTCSICKHPERASIEAAIANGLSLRHIASQFEVGYKAVERHKQNCIKPLLQEVIAQQEELGAFNTLSEMEWMRKQARAIFTHAWGDKTLKDSRTALQSLGELRKQTELYSELTGELDRSTHIELQQSPEWANLREVIFRALQPYPEARVAVARALVELTDGRAVA